MFEVLIDLHMVEDLFLVTGGFTFGFRF